jgi:hypothetical protein
VRRQPYPLLQAARRYQLGMAADALDVDEIAGGKVPDPCIVERPSYAIYRQVGISSGSSVPANRGDAAWMIASLTAV